MAPVPLLADEFRRFWQTERVAREHGSRASLTVPSLSVQGAGSSQFSPIKLWCFTLVAPLLPLLLLGVSLAWYEFFSASTSASDLFLRYPLSLLVLGLPSFAIFIHVTSALLPLPAQPTELPSRPIGHYITFRDDALKRQYTGLSANKKSKIPMETLFEAYFDEKVDFNGDLLDIMEQRYDFASFQITLAQIKFFLTQWIPELLWHSKAQDEEQVREHYDRGNDFYASFLGPRMVYTSGLITNTKIRESLEQIQDNKLEWVCQRMQLKPGDRHLDIGCGWGSLIIYAAKYYSTQSIGVTLAKNQCEFGNRRAQENNVSDNVRFLNMDYRDIPFQKFDKITCLEMAEHVGIRLFSTFLIQVREMLEDDGIFYLQIAGLRRPWTFEDFVWGLFMAKYVFPGADASCPLAWVIDKLETAGFEIREIQTIGTHYSGTIERWYRNWMTNKEIMTERYGVRWTRVWEMFLAWSTIISRQGSATCYQIVAHKNLNSFNRSNLFHKSTSVTGRSL